MSKGDRDSHDQRRLDRYQGKPRPHEESEDCWCHPKVEQRCSCDDGYTEDMFLCSLCNGSGWIAEWDGHSPMIVIHREDNE